ncbi:MAG: helix-hairpin-helix domain-containing protein [Thermoplasmata archaeon]
MALNAEATEIFRTIADFLDLLGEKFKPEAYRRAARSIESLTEDLGAVSDRHELRSIPGVGEAIAEKIEEYLRTGSVSYYERLKREIPAGLVELMRLPGLGPKTARRFWVELGVEGPAELRDAIAAGRLVGVKGFGEKKIEQIRSALDSAAAGPGSSARRPIEEVYPVAHALVEALRAGTGADRVEVAGSFRRARETVGDLDILVTTKEPTKVFEVFTAHPLVGEVKMRGETKETVVLRDGLQVDLRVVRPEEFGAALQYFTGSKDHNVRLRSLARDRGLKVNEYGVFRGEERVAGATEEDVYACLGLAWIPPELREGRAEIEEAARGKLPSLVSEADLRGDLHLHPAPDAQPGELERVVAEARARRYTYVGVIVAGVRDDGTYWILSDATRTRLRELAPSGPALVRGLETGPGPVPKELASIAFDVRVVRPLTSPPVSPPSPETLPPTLIAHVGSSVASDSAALARWVEYARRNHAALEVGPGAERLDSSAARQALEAGVRIHIPTALGAASDDPVRRVALGFARRAGAPPDAVVNVRPESGVSVARSGPRPNWTKSSSHDRPRSRSARKPPP